LSFVFSPSGQNYIHSERDEYNNHHYSINSQTPILTRKINENNILSNNQNQKTNNSLSSSSKVKWMDAVRTVTQITQVRKQKQMSIRNMCIHEETIFIALELYDIHYTTFFSY